MKKYGLAAAFLAVSAALGATPAFAFEVDIGDAMCPLEAIGDAEIESWAPALAESKGQMTDAQVDILGASVKSCAEKLAWSESDTISALEFNLSVIAGSAIGDKLTADGIDAVGYETVLEDRSAADLRQILDDPENSPALQELTRYIVADFGDDLTDEITGDIATYIAFTAQSRLSAMKLMGLAD